MKRLMILCLAILLPAGSLAVPIQLMAVQGNTNGVRHSITHDAVRCSAGQMFFMCGGNKQIVTGVLTADLDGNQITDITGTLFVNGVAKAVTGSLDFDVPVMTLIGSLTIGDLGTFEFFNESFVSPFNSLDLALEKVFLWGQNFAPTLGDAPDGALGTDLVFEYSTTPEPTSLMGVAGLLGLLAFGRRPRRRA